MNIFKYKLAPSSFNGINIKGLQKILSIQAQGNDAVMWAIVDPASDKVRNVSVFARATGEDLPNGVAYLKFVSTVQFPDGLVFHFFISEAPCPA